MDEEFIFVSSAFKHGLTREDILNAWETKVFDGPLEENGYVNKYAFIGFDRAGNPVEVFYNPTGADTIKVFHAMGCRDGIISQLGL